MNSPPIPGDLFVYSNFGYLLLGKVIEAVSKLSYEQFVEANIFQPTGVFDAQVGGDLVGDALPNEVVYYMSPSSGNPYDLPSMKRNGPFAGWVASPIDLLRLMSHLDGFTNKVDILSPESIALLSSATIVSDEAYSRGWVIGSNGWNGWLHSGILPGAASLLVRLDNGVTFAVAMNSEINQKGLQNFWMSIHYLMHHIIDSLDQYPDNDLF
uniref:Beta-lactamase-related domain-containing protein n=1 Tax=Plectus sambesii TaxID=2011161 RepID=A0A914UMD7_9BILA